MIHETFDLEFFNDVFPLEKLRKEAHNDLIKPSGESITGPYHIAVVEQLRSEALTGLAIPLTVPTDVFVYAEGELLNRAATKVGGLPYWPKSTPWPMNEDDDSLVFAGQICFTDSKDLVPRVPSDVLLIFIDYWELIDNPREQNGLQFFWLNIEDQELVGPEDVPESELTINPRYGVRHRTVDFVDPVPSFEQYRRSYLIQSFEGTKIGGMARWIQQAPELEGTFIASLGSIGPKPFAPYPFVNQPKPLEQWNSPDELMWGDAGSLYMSLKEDGSIDWVIQGY